MAKEWLGPALAGLLAAALASTWHPAASPPPHLVFTSATVARALVAWDETAPAFVVAAGGEREAANVTKLADHVWLVPLPPGASNVYRGANLVASVGGATGPPWVPPDGVTISLWAFTADGRLLTEPGNSSLPRSPDFVPVPAALWYAGPGPAPGPNETAVPAALAPTLRGLLAGLPVGGVAVASVADGPLY
ncbi:MAG: hypothetical protein ACYDBQ_04490, partial [Thermoplasmatota archaeon]